MIRGPSSSVLRNERGVTLIEIAIVVAILGLIAAIGIPNYQRSMIRSRQTQAKVLLSGVYMAENVFIMENRSYTTCLVDIGSIRPAAGVSSGDWYYAVGFHPSRAGAGANPKCGNGAQDCHSRNFNYNVSTASWDPETPCSDNTATGAGLAADRKISDGAVLATTATLDVDANPDIDISRNQFTVRVAGQISDNPIYDRWSITHQKVITNYAPGL